MIEFSRVLMGVDFVLFCYFLRLLYLSKKYKEQKIQIAKNVALDCVRIGAIAFLLYGYLLYNEGNLIGFIHGSIILVFLFILLVLEEFELLPRKAVL